MLNTWRRTEKPPNPSKKLHKITLVESMREATRATSDTPFVSSKIPVKNPGKNSILTPNNPKHRL